MPLVKQKPKVKALNLRHGRTKSNAWTKPPEKVTAISLKITRKGKNTFSLEDFPLQKIINLEQSHKHKEVKTPPQRLWKLSENHESLLLI